MKKLLLLTIAAFALHLLDGCGGSSTAPPPVATHLSVSSSTTTAMVGAAFNITVRALDASGAVVSNYSDTVHFMSTDSQAVLPTNSTLTNGTGTFSATLKTTGGQTITATDTVTASVTGSSNSINVTTNATYFSLTAPVSVSAQKSFNFTVTALDASNNVATSYSGTAHFTSTDAQAVLPPNATLTNGTGTFSATLKTVGSQTITATDTVMASIAGTSNAINANASGPLAITSGPLPGGSLGAVYGGYNPCPTTGTPSFRGFQFTASGGTAPYSWSASSMPSGLTFNGPICAGGQGNGDITGTPTSAGSFPLSVTVSDSGSPKATVSATYTITIGTQPQSSLAITSRTPPVGVVGTLYDQTISGYCQPIGQRCYPCFPAASTRICGSGYRTLYTYGFTLTAAGGVQSYSWQWAPQPNSSLPPGLDLSAAGTISGTPTSRGSFNITVTVTDSASPASQATNNYTLNVNNPQIPVINATPSPSSGAVSLSYQFVFTATGGTAPLLWSESGTLPPGLLFSNTGELSGVPTTTGVFPLTISAQDSAGQNATPQDFAIRIYSHGFKATGNMGTARTGHTASLLSDGKVLVAGAYSLGVGLSTAELFDPNNGSFASTGSMQTGRFDHSATVLSSLLPNAGKVLVAGGYTATAELFDPMTGTFVSTGSMETVRTVHTATLLSNGKVLVVGGGDSNLNPLSSAELFDPSTGTFTSTGNMAMARYGHTATLLKDGRVLITGGLGATQNPIATAELYDPSTGTFTPTGSMTMSRYTQTATLLTNGKVLVTGGLGSSSATVTAELFDPANGSFAATGNMEDARSFHVATLLHDGTVLVTGGEDANRNTLSSAELFDSSSGTFTPTGSMGNARFAPTITLLQNGAVLVTGGTGGAATPSTSELYQ